MTQDTNARPPKSGSFSHLFSHMTAVTYYNHAVVITWADGTEEVIEKYRSLVIAYA